MHQQFFKLVQHPIKFRMFLFSKLPAAFFSGVRVVSIDSTTAKVKVPYKWLTQNPFKSTYFASLSMAAEMSSGVLALAYLHQRQPNVSMLVQALEATFTKKATDVTTFICNDGKALNTAITQAIQTNQPTAFKTTAIGYNKNGEEVAQFFVTWGFKAKQ
jgi:Domain of unknown function (DUF4442)